MKKKRRSGERLIRLATADLAGGRPGEVSNGDNEEAVASVGDTGEGIVPGGEGSQETEQTTSLLDIGIGGTISTLLQVSDTEQEEGQVQEEEQQEEGDGRFEGANQHDGGKDEPTLWEVSDRDRGSSRLRVDAIWKGLTYHQEQTEGIVEFGGVCGQQFVFDLKSTGGQNNGEGEPEATVRGQSSCTKSVTDSHFPANATVSAKATFEFSLGSCETPGF